MRSISRLPDAIQPEWAGATVAILGGGPSLGPEQVAACRGRARVIAINNAVSLAPWADLLYFADRRWYAWHPEWVQAFKGRIVTINNRELRAKIPGLICMRNDGQEGFCESPDGLRTGSHSGYQAIQVAAHLGVKRIILLGIDMCTLDGKTHWHPEHPDPASPGIYTHTMLPKFLTIVEPLKKRGIQVINASLRSAVECFPKMPLEEALDGA